MFSLREYHTENVNDDNLMNDQHITKSFIPGGSYIKRSFIVANKLNWIPSLSKFTANYGTNLTADGFSGSESPPYMLSL